VLELRAIDLDHCAGISKKDFRGRFDDACLSRTCRTQKKQVPHWTARRIQSGAKNLKHIDEGLHALFLTYDLGPQGSVKITGVIAADGWIQLMADGRFHFINPSSRLAPPNAKRVSNSRVIRLIAWGLPIFFHSLHRQKAEQTQQHTGFGILETVSSPETVFHLQTKSETQNSLCHAPDDKKGRAFSARPWPQLKCCFNYFTCPASCVLVREPRSPRRVVLPAISCRPRWFR
jgi:hypothetical protein